MASVNKVILVGNLGRDPELKYTPGGMAVATFTIATTSGGGRDKEQVTEWHSIVVFDKTAENCSQYLQKGRQVYIEGRLQTRSWDDKQSGQKRYKTEIVANQVVFLGQQQGQAQQGQSQGGGGRQQSQGQQQRGGNQGGQRQQQGQQQGQGGWGGFDDSGDEWNNDSQQGQGWDADPDADIPF